MQRALLRLKEEEQADEDELLCACGYRRASLASCTEESVSVAVRSSRDAEQSTPLLLSATRSADVQLPPPPEVLGPLVSLTPEYYTLDELRHALQYLPDPLLVSLYRVSLLYMLDNDRDGRINSTDISFFMDWGIKTVGRDVLPDQLAEVLQTYAALHCWHCCLHVGERIEAVKAAAATQPQAGHVGNTSASGAGRTRRHHISLPSVVGTLPLHQHHEQHHSQSVTSFMLLHFREAFLNASADGPVPLPGKMDIMTTKSSVRTVSPTQSSPSLRSSPSAVSQPVTDNVRHAAAAHFAEWMLRLVQHQERDRRHERQRFERRLRSMATAADVRLGCTTRLRHPSYVAQQSLRLRLSATFLPTEAASADASADGDDFVVPMTWNSTPGQHQSMLCTTLSADVGAVAASWDAEDGAPELGVVEVLAPPSQLAKSLPFSKSPPLTSKSKPPISHRTAATLPTCVNTPPQSSSPSSNVTPLNAPVAPDGGNSPPNGTSSPLLSSAMGTPFTPAGSFPDDRRRAAAGGALITETSAVAPTTRSKSFGGSPCVSCLNTAVSPEDVTAGGDRSVNGAGAPEGDLNGSGFSNVNGWASSSSIASATGAGAAAAAATALSGGPAASLLAYQVSVLLMDAEVFYAELEANGWCTIGAVEEVYLDFAVEESYCLPFWSFCRLLNKASADEVQAALELPTDQAVAVLTSAVAVEEYRRAAAVRQLQRHTTMQRDGGHGSGNRCCSSSRGDDWARNLQVIPMFVVSEYTFVTFVAAFIHAYWAMLESMNVDPVM